VSAFQYLPDRRVAIRSILGSSLLLPGIVNHLLASDSQNPLAPREPHYKPKAKRVIFLFSTGGVSHMDTFDHKPALFKADGKTFGAGGGLSDKKKLLVKPKWEFKPGGKCGTLVSDLFPKIREKMDDICLIKSMKSDENEHYQATLAMHCGSFFFTRPSFGSWVSYGLGTINQNLPSFIVIAPHLPYAGTQVYGNDFLPAYHQGTRVVPGKDPVPNLEKRTKKGAIQEMELGLSAELNQQHLKQHGNNSDLAARMQSFETAFRMQTEAPEAFDLTKETKETLDLYGLKPGETEGYAWQCLVARRLAERGVRFIELIDFGSSNNWDAHDNMSQHEGLAKKVDQPIAALLTDLKQRGMLEDTLVVWTTEFGRTPGEDGKYGRGHHSACFSSWIAGAGVRAGTSYGETDEIAGTVAKDRVHVHDFHATLLHLLGFDHEKLTYRHGGRDYRLTDVHGNVIKGLLS
jgi:hypothetical protein